jgi:hypothetical protein
MAITVRGVSSTGVNSATAPSCDHPAGVAAGDLLIIHLSYKYNAASISTPSGWIADATVVDGGNGAAGIDSGSVTTRFYWRVATAAESGTVTFTVTSGNIAQCRMIALTASGYPRTSWDLKVDSGTDSTVDTAWSIASSGNLDSRPNDYILSLNGMNYDTATYSAYTYTQTGATFGARSQQWSIATTGGDDQRLQAFGGLVSTGTVNAALTASSTASGSVANGPCGSGIIIRIRERRRRIM